VGRRSVLPPLRRTVEPFAAFFQTEAASGILLMACAAVAVVWANVAGDSYEAVRQRMLTIGSAPFVLSKPVLLWINDGLMAVFFLLVGLEIKRELLDGELASPRRAALPVVAAAGGMAAPAAIYAALNFGGPGARGWGIPVATDIAFALGALALLGGRTVASLRVFLTAVAIVDDLGAVVLIAVVYTADLAWVALAAAAIVLAALAVLNRAGIQHPAPYAVVGLTLWGAVVKSGIHATVAGVLLAMTIPARRAEPAPGGVAGQNARPLLHRLEHALHPWVAIAVMPLFALANAGVRLSGGSATLLDPITLGVIVGLVVGKQLGVMASCWAAVRFGVATLPSRATWRQLHGIALLCGIGFTMSLFIATLAFDEPGTLAHAKIGVLAGSLVSGVVGYLVLARAAVASPERP
jgi:NhaA family Na+:H+ antiporter